MFDSSSFLSSPRSLVSELGPPLDRAALGREAELGPPCPERATEIASTILDDFGIMPVLEFRRRLCRGSRYLYQVLTNGGLLLWTSPAFDHGFDAHRAAAAWADRHVGYHCRNMTTAGGGR